MDEATVREAAETHARATVERDYATAGSYLSEEMKASAGDVMKQMPGRLTSADVVGVETAGDEAVARIRYSGEEGSTTVESRWSEVDGRPTIVGLDVTEKT
jgi:uncharacterized protein YpuA (DUF1002 family)